MKAQPMPANSKNNKGFQQVQRVFTQHMRDPANTSPPADVETRRIKVYRDLIYKNIENFIANSFPVLRKMMPDDEWHELLYDYVCLHQSQTPLFPKMPREFLKYLEQDEVKTRYSEQYPYMLELAHYEWMETAASLDSREINLSDIDIEGELLSGVPVLNPLAIPLMYDWPVHLISPENPMSEKPAEPTFIVVYRDCLDDVGFMVLNNVSARLIEKIQLNEDKSGREILIGIAKELNHPEPEIVISGGLSMMQNMLEKQMILGIKKSR